MADRRLADAAGAGPPDARVRVHGCGPAVLLCPGLGMSSDSWDAVAADLSADHLVIRYDRPGLGPGVPPRRQVPTLCGEADQVTAVLAAAGPDGPAVLVGHSLAGFLVEAVARCHPHLVAGLVLVDASIEPFATDPAAWVRRWWTGVGRAAAAVPVLGRRLSAVAFEQAGYPGMTADLRALRSRTSLPAVPVHVQAAVWLDWWASRRWVRKQRLLRTLLSDGHPDGLRSVTFEVIPRCGHRVMRYRPERVTAAVRSMSGVAPSDQPGGGSAGP